MTQEIGQQMEKSRTQIHSGQKLSSQQKKNDMMESLIGLPECYKERSGGCVYTAWKPQGNKILGEDIWDVAPPGTHFHLWGAHCEVPSLTRSKASSPPHALTGSSWRLMRRHLLLSFSTEYSPSFSSPQLFIRRLEKGVWIGAWTTVESSLTRFVCPPSLTAVSKLKLGILSLRATFIFTSLPLNIYKSFGERIKPRIQRNEWLNLDSDGIKWANRNSWQKLYDGEVITCGLLPHCRRWEWSAGLVYRSNCMTQLREW